MKTTMKTMLTLLALGASAFLINAQGTGGPPPDGGPGGAGPRHRPPPLPLVTVLDANHDGVIDASEIADAPAALKTLDKNGDGQLTTEEYLPPLPPGAPKDAPRPPLPPIVKVLDTNGDGVIDAGEIANASAALKALDRNGDGQLSRNEFCPPPPPRQNGDTARGDQSAPPDDAPAGPPPTE